MGGGYDPAKLARWAFTEYSDLGCGYDIDDSDLQKQMMKVIVMEEGFEFEMTIEQLRQFPKKS